LDEAYDLDDVVFLSLEFDKIVRPKKFKTDRLFNIHFSLLPKYKGMYTSVFPIINRDDTSGVTLHCIDSGIDTGDIIDQMSFPLTKKETCESLYLKYIDNGTSLVLNNIHNILNNKFKQYPQKTAGSTYNAKDSIDFNHITIPLNQTASELDAIIRAFHFRSYQLPCIMGSMISSTHICDEKSPIRPGNVINETDEFLKLSTIDYNILLFKDKFIDVLNFCKENNVDALQAVPNIESYINEKETKHGWTPLMVAAYNGAMDTITYLISIGADVNAQNFNGTTVAMYAKEAYLQGKGISAIKTIIENGANLFTKDYNGKNIFDYVKEDGIPVENFFGKLL